jgi:ribosomal protein L7Ae-like RNA K-turn-binding protein
MDNNEAMPFPYVQVNKKKTLGAIIGTVVVYYAQSFPIPAADGTPFFVPVVMRVVLC